MVNITSSVITENEKAEMEDVLKDLDLTNISDTEKWKIAESRSIQKIDDYMTSVQNDNSLDEQEKNKIFDNMLDVRNMREKLDNEKAESIKQQTEAIAEIQDEKEAQKEVDLDKVNELKKLLSEKDEQIIQKTETINSMQNQIDELKKELSEISDKNHDALETLKEAKKSKDQEVIKTQREMILKLIQERKALRDKYAWELPKYEWNINTLETKRIELKLFASNSVDWQKVLTWPQLRFRQNFRSRKRINTTVRRLNEIWSDPKKWVNFVLTRTFGYDPLSISWKVWTGFKNMRKFFKIRDVNAFDEMYNKQKKYFIEDLESKMASNSMSENDKKVIAAIKNRLDYYQAAYKRQFIVA